MNKTTRRIVAASAFGVLILGGLYQNCGGTFAVDPKLLSTQSASITGTAGTSDLAGLSNAGFKSCRSNTSQNLFNCLEAGSAKKGVLTRVMVDTCTVATPPPSDFDAALCLTRAGFAIFGYREPLQSDIETCAAKVGTTKLAACLNKNGVLPATITQPVIDSCLSTVGLVSLEKCLRKNNHLVKKYFLSNADVSTCQKVLDSAALPSAVMTCLGNMEVLPATVLAMDLELCLSNAPTAVAKCLRANRKVSRVIMQANITTCANAAGVSGIARCLDGNGYLYDSLLPAEALQSTIDTCVLAAGVDGVARCLRGRGVLERSMLQAQIASCITVVGQAGALNCLRANGLLDQAGFPTNGLPGKAITQADIDACAASAGAGGIAGCLAGARAILDPNPKQDVFNLCHRLADASGMANCMNASGMLPGGVTQAGIDICLAQPAGLAGVETCLRNRGALP